jgi:hypothetical protein
LESDESQAARARAALESWASLVGRMPLVGT